MSFCTYCGKQVADEAVICLNCGCQVKRFAQAPNVIQQPPVKHVFIEEKESSLAIWSKVCGAVSFFFGWFALGITAIVLAVCSKSDSDGEMSPSAKVGFVCGIVSTALSFVLIVLLIVLMSEFGSIVV